MIFKTSEHKQRYEDILKRMKSCDSYHRSLAYLIALDSNITGSRISACFDFSEDSIKPGVFEESWLTGTDRRVLQLAFNLWNNVQQANVSDVFSGSDLEYLFESIRIRFDS